MQQIDPPWPVYVVDGNGLTEAGPGMCAMALDYGPDYHTLWCVFMDRDGSPYWVPMQYIRSQFNASLGRFDGLGVKARAAGGWPPDRE
jgi:hypothetical protein